VTAGKGKAATKVRCAIYTRKSTEEGLEQEYNSLDAQRDSAEAYIKSQAAEGWTMLPTRYDDGGFSGGNLERPALERLLADIEAGHVDCVVVYKVDRMSRSLIDFMRLMEVFDRRKVSFVSVTQQFNTAQSMGRLTLHILLSFAQFEREMISERIRDKIAAQRRKGKWAGGVPVLGYDVDRSGPSPRLVVNPHEAAQVRTIFDLYIRLGTLLPVVDDLRKRGWCNKARVTAKGRRIGGKPFDKQSLHDHLTNPVYVGKVVHKGDVFDGEHDPIVPLPVFAEVQRLLRQNGRSGSPEVRNKHGAFLRGLLCCKACGRAMVHTFSSPRGAERNRMYRYYRCSNAIKSGASRCPRPSLPAEQVEAAVVEEMRALASDRDLLAKVIEQAQGAIGAETAALRRERGDLAREMDRLAKGLQDLPAAGLADRDAASRAIGLHERIAASERRMASVEARLDELGRRRIGREEAEAAFADFDGIWRAMTPWERRRVARLLIERVDYDDEAESIEVTFRPDSIRAFADRALEEAA
jgi:site-specific DNA recombinase